MSRTPWRRAAVLVAIIATIVVESESKQEPPRNTGIIRGRVTDTQSGTPITSAEIAASCCVHSGGIRTTAVDGRYELTVPAPGDYVVTAKAPKYVHTAFGQASLSSIVPVDATLATSVRVRAGEIIPDVDIQLPRSAAISGRVFGDSGEALADVEVELLREMYQPSGVAPVPVAFGTIERVAAEQTMSGAQFGTYRISGLPPGSYVVRAYATESVRPTRGGRSAAYVPTFFPRATRFADARPIVLRAGQEISNLDFTLVAAATHTVSGRLVGQRVADATVELRPIGPGSEAGRPRASVARDGRFRIGAVVPGNYVLAVADTGGNREWTGVRRAIVVAAEVRNVEIPPIPAVHIEGRFVQDDGGSLSFDPNGIHVALDYDSSAAEGVRERSIEGRAAADGTFSIDALPGRAWLRAMRPSGGHLPSPFAAIQAVRVDGIDVTDTAIPLAAGARHRMEIVTTRRAGGLAGTASDAQDRPARYALVVMFPNDRLRLGASRLIRVAFADRDGRYEIDPLPAGNYRIVAVPTLPRDAWRDPAVLDHLWPAATAVRLNEGERRTLHLRLSPAPTL